MKMFLKKFNKNCHNDYDDDDDYYYYYYFWFVTRATKNSHFKTAKFLREVRKFPLLKTHSPSSCQQHFIQLTTFQTCSELIAFTSTYTQ